MLSTLQIRSMLTMTGSVADVTNKVYEYQMISMTLLGAAIVFAVISIVLWFRLRISHVFSMLTGASARKGIAELEKSAVTDGVHSSGKLMKERPSLNWTTAQLKKTENLQTQTQATTLLQKTEEVQTQATTLLEKQEDAQATTLLKKPGKKAAANGFRMEKDMVFTHSEEKMDA